MLRDLAPEQVERLDPVGALVDGIEAVVAPQPFHREFARVAVAAEHLDREVVGLGAEARGPGLHDRREHVEAQARGFARAGILRRSLQVHLPRGVHRERQAAFDQALLPQQHAPHVGVRDQRHRRTRRVLLVGMPALPSLACVLQRLRIAGHAQHHRAHADADARLVHHVEHLRQPLVLGADQFADAVAVFAELEEGVDDAALPELVVEPGQAHVVVRADHDLAIHATAVDAVARHHEQADAAHARRRAGRAREHEVHDVLRQFVLAAGDPHLLAADRVAPAAERFGARGDVAQRGAGLRLAQAHRAEEAAVQDRLSVTRLLRVGAERAEQVGDAAREQQVARRGHVCGEQVRVGEQHHAVGQLQAAVGGVGAERAEAGVAVGIHRLAHRSRQHDAAGGDMRLVAVGQRRMRREAFARQSRRGIDDRVPLSEVMAGVTRQAQQVVQRPEPRGELFELSGVDHRGA
jgi:hypothetical protein